MTRFLRRIFRPTISDAGRTMALRRAEIRRATEREKLRETTAKLCIEAGIPVPPCFR